MSGILGAGNVGSLDREHNGVHEILRRLNERSGAVEAGDNELTTDVLHISLDLARDVHLMAVESNSLQISEQILLCRALGALVGNLPCEFVELRAVLGDLFSGVDDVHGGLEGTTTTGKVRHLHHDHAHVLGEDDNVVAGVVPLGDLAVELELLALEVLDLLQDLLLVFFGHLAHSLAGRCDAADLRVLVDTVLAGLSARLAACLQSVVLVQLDVFWV